MELCSRYSNRDDLLEPLVRVLEQINQDLLVSEPKDQLVSADGATPKAWRVADRLSPTDLANLVASYRGGTTIRDLAEQFNLGTTTVKRLLREHGARKRRPRGAA